MFGTNNWFSIIPHALIICGFIRKLAQTPRPPLLLYFVVLVIEFRALYLLSKCSFTSAMHLVLLLFLLLFQMRYCTLAGQASDHDPPTGSRVAGITGMHHHVQPSQFPLNQFILTTTYWVLIIYRAHETFCINPDMVFEHLSLRA
jgi:hypothetical protein